MTQQDRFVRIIMSMETRKKFQKSLLPWFEKNRRDLPWRKTYSPYHIWISEIILQQTQMERGVYYFNRFMEQFPDLIRLSKATESDILKLWEGLGYYNRARNIVKSAKIISEQYGRMPDDFETLLKLPGIGRYTAAAILSLAFNQDYPVVDTNVERVFSRIFNLAEPVKDRKSQKNIHNLAVSLMPHGQARNFNQSLMELGVLICLNKNPRCRQCPLNYRCESLAKGIVDERPVPGKSSEIVRMEMATGVLLHKGKLFIQQRPEHGVWANLWEFPGGRLEIGESPVEALTREFLEETELTVHCIKPITIIRHSYTRYRITLHCFLCTLLNNGTQPVLHEAQNFRWVAPVELQSYAFPAGHRKLIEFMTHQNLLGQKNSSSVTIPNG